MTTSSARPEALRDHARRLRREAQLADDAASHLAVGQTAYLDQCPAGHPPGEAAIAARRAIDAMADLPSGLGSVADAFTAADRGPTISAVTDSRLVSSLVLIAPGLTADVGIHDGVAHEQGRRFGMSLIGADADDVVDRLINESSATADPAFAAGVLEGIGADGLGRLAVETQHDSNAIGGSPADEVELWRHLGRVFDCAATAVHRLPNPGATPQVDPGGLDLALIATLGRNGPGRLALRHLAEHMRRPSTAVVVAFADVLLLGESAAGDTMAAGRALSTVGLQEAPGTRGEARTLQFLAEDPMASFRLELLHPTGTSPALQLLGRDGWGPAPEGAARNLHNVAVIGVQRGWAQPWADPLAGSGAAYDRLPVPRVLHGLIDEVIDLDASCSATPALSRALAAVVATHPIAFEVATAQAEFAATEPRQHAPARFYQAIARDRDALTQVTETLATRHRDAVVASVASRAPGATSVHAALVDTVLTHQTLELLVEGAHDAGRERHVGVTIASVLGGVAVGKALPALGKLAGPAGAWVGSQGARVAKGAISDYREEHEVTYDRREREAQHELERDAALAGAIAMTRDPVWSPLLQFRPGGLQPDELAHLDVGGSDGDHHRFEQWLAEQPDARVTEVLRALIPPDA